MDVIDLSPMTPQMCQPEAFKPSQLTTESKSCRLRTLRAARPLAHNTHTHTHTHTNTQHKQTPQHRETHTPTHSHTTTDTHVGFLLEIQRVCLCVRACVCA